MIKRTIYQFLLRLYPLAFRERFAEEMLWIFDETIEDAGLLRLCTDAAFSLVKQHMTDGDVPQSTSQLFGATPRQTLSAVRILQAGVVASIALIGFLELLQQSVPLPLPSRTFAIRRYRPDVCSEWNFASRPSDGQHSSRREPIDRSDPYRIAREMSK